MSSHKEVAGGERTNSESRIERLARFGRNFNTLGAVALGGLAALIPGPNVVLGTLAGVNALQAGGFELARRSAKNKHRRH